MYRRYDKVINTYQKVVVDYRRRLTTSFRWTSFPILDFPLLLQHKDKRKVARAVNRTTWKCRTLVWTNILVYPRGVKICPYSGWNISWPPLMFWLILIFLLTCEIISLTTKGIFAKQYYFPEYVTNHLEMQSMGVTWTIELKPEGLNKWKMVWG